MKYFSNLNLNGIKSELVSQLKNNTKLNKTEIPEKYTNHIQDFNCRNFNYKNVNTIIDFCEFLEIEHLIDFVLKNLEPTTEKIDLNISYLHNYIFPYFILRGITNRPIEDNLQQSCKFGMVNWLKFFHEKFSIDLEDNSYSSLYLKAVKNGHLDILEYLYKYNCPIHKDSCFYAAEKGHINCLEFVHKHGCELDEEVFDISIEHEHFDICDYLLEHNCSINQISLCQIVIENNMKECLDYILRQHLIEDVYDLATDSIIVDSLECLKVLHNHGLKLTYTLIETSADYGSLDCMKYLHKHGCEFGESLCKKAIYYANVQGYFTMLYYLIAYKCPGYKECEEFLDIENLDESYESYESDKSEEESEEGSDDRYYTD